jgi:hypothetical protein
MLRINSATKNPRSVLSAAKNLVLQEFLHYVQDMPSLWFRMTDPKHCDSLPRGRRGLLICGHNVVMTESIS